MYNMLSKILYILQFKILFQVRTLITHKNNIKRVIKLINSFLLRGYTANETIRSTPQISATLHPTFITWQFGPLEEMSLSGLRDG